MKKNESGTKRFASLVALALMAGPICWSADMLTVKSHDGSCQVAVPASWSVGASGGTAESSDKNSSLAVSSPKMIDSFAELKQTAKSLYANSKVTKDSATEFSMEGESMNRQPDVYRAVPIAGTKFCIVEVVYKTGSPDEARAIAQTLKGAK
jgi:hypothetical protein